MNWQYSKQVLHKILVFFSTLCGFFISSLWAQPSPGYWQQRVKYEMDIKLNTSNHRFEGKQLLTYTNNSPDTLRKAFFHLYLNAFQPYSMMDMRSRTISDPDPRVLDRILHLKPEEIGYQKILSLKQDEQNCSYTTVGTILEVELALPILPGDSTTFHMDYEAQVPIQIRRTGRDNKEGIDYSMTQWYPKLCQYDQEGWHANPYVGREYYGILGDFDVKITLDSSYTIGGTGYLQNPEEIGHGYAEQSIEPTSSTLTWHFKAPNVPDFGWAADPDYIHDIKQVKNGPALHFFYQKVEAKGVKNWQEMQDKTVKVFELLIKEFGPYPYDTYSILQGGDGGMEYPMAFLMTGDRSVNSMIGTSAHEIAHSWIPMVLITNESKYQWIDEGFANYAASHVTDIVYEKDQLNPHKGAYESYEQLVRMRIEEPMSTHGDHFLFNTTYGSSAYSKGQVFFHQLSYVIGKDNFFTGFKRFYLDWQFKHPTPRDMKRVFEKSSGLELDWYWEYMIHSIKFVDYTLDTVYQENNRTQISLLNSGLMPMPIDLMVTYKDGSKELLLIPMRIMRGAKKETFYGDVPTKVLEDWAWTHPVYELNLARPMAEIQSIEIDPSHRMADINREDNRWENN